MSVAVGLPTKSERIEAYRTASWPHRIAMHNAIAEHKRAAIAARRELGRRYLAQQPDGIVVLFERAALAVELEAETRAAREQATALAVGRASQHESASLQYPVLGHYFPTDSDVIRLALSPLFLVPITRYCGMLPVLFNLFVTRAYQPELNRNSAHHFHMDPEDIISFKVFIHLTDVDEDCGPLHVLPADLTERVLKAVDYHGIGYIADERVDELVGLNNAIRFVGPAGTVALADTTRCLHFGGRPRAAGKPVRDMLVFQYLLPTSLLFPIGGDAKNPRFLPQLEATGDDTWDALIGATLT
jgi:hypothetical protein